MQSSSLAKPAKVSNKLGSRNLKCGLQLETNQTLPRVFTYATKETHKLTWRRLAPYRA